MTVDDSGELRPEYRREDFGQMVRGKKYNSKIIVEKHSDGYVAFPLGIKGVVVGEGDTYEEAIADLNSAIAFHVESFGAKVLESKEER